MRTPIDDAARRLRREADLGGALAHPVHVVAELAAVVDRGDVIPGAERMQPVAVHQRLLRVAAVAVAVQIPLAVDHADLEQHPVVASRLLQVEPALLGPAAVGTEDRFPRERLGPGQRMDVDHQRIIHAVELDRLADRRLDDARVAEDGRRMTADAIEAIEGPDLLVGGDAGIHRAR